MATSFPAGTDNFNVPNSPGSTALSSAGTGSRNHVQHHRDLGDAIEAMQAQATLLVHSHDGSTARHGEKLDQANTHESADTDSSTSAIHHTLGTGANQAAPGDHSGLPEFASTHAGAVVWPVGSVFMTTVAGNPSGSPHDLGGTWVQITDAFLIGAGGSYSYTGSVVAATTTHNHTVSATSSSGSHTHTIATPTSTDAAHKHSSGNTASNTASHSHTGSSTGPNSTANRQYINPLKSVASSGHTHTLPTASDNTSHSHVIGDYAETGSHSHSIGVTSNPGNHSHTVSLSSPSHIPPWRAFYVWRRTA